MRKPSQARTLIQLLQTLRGLFTNKLPSTEMNLVSYDECGLLKLVDVRKKNVLQRWGTQTRKAGVARMTWLPGPATAAGAASSISNAASITFNGTVEVWDPLTQTMMHSIRNAGADTVVMAPRGGDLVLCTKQGDVRVLPLTGKDAEKDSKIKFNAGKQVSCGRLHSNGQLALGGRENDLQLWDLEKGVSAFKAKNVPVDFLGRPVPIWITGLQFLPESGGGGGGAGLYEVATSHSLAGGRSSPFNLVTVTGHKHVRIYDIRASPRPTQSVEIGEFPFTCMELASDGNRIFTGDTIGTIRCIDLRVMRQHGGYKGSAGSIRAMAVHPYRDFIATASADRHVLIHDTESREEVRRLYLKQRLTGCMWAPCVLEDLEEEEAAYGTLQPEEDEEKSKVIRRTKTAEMEAAAPKLEASAGGAGAGSDEDDEGGYDEAEAEGLLTGSEDDESEGYDEGQDGEEEEEGEAAARLSGKKRRAAGSAAAGGAGAEEEADVWAELERRGKQADKAKAGTGAVAAAAPSSSSASAAKKATAPQQKAGKAGKKEESEEEEEEEEDEDADSELDFGGGSDGEEDDEDDDEDDEEDSDDDSEDDGGKGRKGSKKGKKGVSEVDSEEEAAAFVDSSAAAKMLKKTVNAARREQEKDSRRMKAGHAHKVKAAAGTQVAKKAAAASQQRSRAASKKARR